MYERTGKDLNKIIGVKIDTNNNKVRPDFTRVGYIFWEDNLHFRGEKYSIYTCMNDIENDFGRDSYVYRLAEKIFSRNQNIREVVIGYAGKYLEQFFDAK